MFPIVITVDDFVTIGLLGFMEIILSVDNALVLAMLARVLPKQDQPKAIWYGFAASIFLRVIAIFLASHLIHMTWIKWAGGAYLIYIAVAHAFKKSAGTEQKHVPHSSFAKVVTVIVFTDLAFAVDSILAAVALSSKVWVVITGAVIGIVCLRFASSIFLVLLEKRPKLETTAYLLVFGVGIKLVLDGIQMPGWDFHDSANPLFWIFWFYIFVSIAFGFLPKRKRKHA